jgi:hypothetical protein
MERQVRAVGKIVVCMHAATEMSTASATKRSQGAGRTFRASTDKTSSA